MIRDTDTVTRAYVGPHYEARFTKTDKPEDLDDDCQVTVIDIMRVARRWGQAGRPEDVNGDGTVDVGDVQQVAGQWRETCHVLAETVKYYALGGRRVAMRRNNALYYLFGDHLGSTSVTYRASDGQTTTQRYYPWGTIRPGPANTLPTDRTFTGQQLDPNIGLLYYSDGTSYGRYYDPSLGRWTQPDPIVPNPGNPQDLNRYSYASNNPVRFVDPNGHCGPLTPVCVILTLAGIGLLLHGDDTSQPVSPGEQNAARLGGALMVASGGLTTGYALFGPSPAATSAGASTVTAACADGDCTNEVNAVTQVASSNTTQVAQRLVEAGLDSPDAPKLVQQIAAASTNNPLVSGGTTVLGKYPEYIQEGQVEGMTYFNMPSQVWNVLNQAGEEFVWAVNKQFLDNAIAAGNRFVVAVGEQPGGTGLKPINGYLQREIQYLLSQGYRWVDGVLVPGS